MKTDKCGLLNHVVLEDMCSIKPGKTARCQCGLVTVDIVASDNDAPKQHTLSLRELENNVYQVALQ